MYDPAETIRQFANLLAIGEWGMLRMHAQYCLEWAEQEHGNAYSGPARRLWLARRNAFEEVLALIDKLEEQDD